MSVVDLPQIQWLLTNPDNNPHKIIKPPPVTTNHHHTTSPCRCHTETIVVYLHRQRLFRFPSTAFPSIASNQKRQHKQEDLEAMLSIEYSQASITVGCRGQRSSSFQWSKKVTQLMVDGEPVVDSLD
ncbi:hypothetical protein LXL04_009649 [Taraxacum kok-saghyz]